MPFDGTNNEAIEIIGKMKAMLSEPTKWVKNILKLGEAHCLYGALNQAHHGNENMPPMRHNPLRFDGAYQIVHKAMSDEAKVRSGQDWSWTDYAAVYYNNDPKTTHADILDFLDAVERRLMTA